MAVRGPRYPLYAECRQAVEMLRSWGLIYPGAQVDPRSVLPVLEKYAKHHRYTMGQTLYEHLAHATVVGNICVNGGYGTPSEKLEEFFFKTTVLSYGLGEAREREEFDRASRKVSHEYGVDVVYDESIGSRQNLEKVRSKEQEMILHRFQSQRNAS